MSGILVKYHTSTGIRNAILYKEGRRWLHLLVQDFPMHVTRVPKGEAKYMRVMPDKIPHARNVFRRMAVQTWGRGNLPANIKEALAP